MRLLALLLVRLLRELRKTSAYQLWWLVRTFLVINGVMAVGVFIYLLQPYRLAYNNSWSMPKGLWVHKVGDGPPYHRHETIQAHYVPPDWIKKRGWSDPLHTTIIKHIGAVPGDRLKVEKGRVYDCPPDTGCHLLGRRLATDGQGKQMHYVALPRIVPPGHFFLLGRNPRSLDSRYLGLFGVNAIIGKVSALATRPIPDKAKALIDNQSYIDDKGDRNGPFDDIPNQSAPLANADKNE